MSTPLRSLALIAHDNRKVDLVAWATFNRDTLAQFVMMATRHTARLMRDKVGLDVEVLLSGPEGGDAQIAARVATGSVDAVFFFVDPLTAQPHDPDIRALLRVCNVHTSRWPPTSPRPISSSPRCPTRPAAAKSPRPPADPCRGAPRG